MQKLKFKTSEPKFNRYGRNGSGTVSSYTNIGDRKLTTYGGSGPKYTEKEDTPHILETQVSGHFLGLSPGNFPANFLVKFPEMSGNVI